jgi:hypothetical protein
VAPAPFFPAAQATFAPLSVVAAADEVVNVGDTPLVAAVGENSRDAFTEFTNGDFAIALRPSALTVTGTVCTVKSRLTSL